MRKEAAAKFTSRCSTCGVTIHPGETITYDPAVKYSSRHKACPVAQNPKPKVAKGALLNGPVIAQPQSSRLSDEHAAEILAGLVSQFIRPLPACKPTLGLGYKISVEGKWLSVGTSGEWVGIATDFHPAEGEAQEYVVSLIDGTILEHAEWRKTKVDAGTGCAREARSGWKEFGPRWRHRAHEDRVVHHHQRGQTVLHERRRC